MATNTPGEVVKQPYLHSAADSRQQQKSFGLVGVGDRIGAASGQQNSQAGELKEVFLKLVPRGVFLGDRSKRPPILGEPSHCSGCFGTLVLSLVSFSISRSSDVCR